MGKKRLVTIGFAASAVKDLEEMRAWYADQQVPDVGERILREVVFRIETLAKFPESGRVVPEFDIAQLREIIHPPFRIVYRIDKARVRIVRVWRSERLLRIPCFAQKGER
jgi:toxin ParE1/3/4